MSERRLTRSRALVWLAALAAVPGLLWALSSATEVAIVGSESGIYAEVNGTRLGVPADRIAPASSDCCGTSVGPQETSRFWQPAHPNALEFLGQAGAWVQRLRPRGRWVELGTEHASNPPRVAHRFKLVAGRTPATLALARSGTSATAPALSLVLRPEGRNMAWWRQEPGRPAELLVNATYTPVAGAVARDVAAELLLLASASAALALLASSLNALLLRLVRDENRVSGLSWGGAFRDLTSPPWLCGAALFSIMTLSAVAACLVLLEGIPHVQDEVGYIFQAKVFALGRSWVPEPPGRPFFDNAFIEMFRGRWFAKYPPGYPLLLVPGIWMGAPWLVNPLCGGLALVLVNAAGLRTYGRRVATWAALLGLLSPWIIIMSASYMSHPATMMWTALFLYALVRTREEPIGPRWPLVAGFAIGMAFITRPWTALGIGLAVAAWALGDVAVFPGTGRAARLLRYALLFVGFLPPTLFMLYENKELMGGWLRLPQELVGEYDRPGFGEFEGGGHTPVLGLFNALLYWRALAAVLDGWPAPLALAPVALGLLAWRRDSSERRAWDVLMVLGALGLVTAYFFFWSANTIFGPRYWYEAMPFLLLLAGRGLDLLGRLASGGLEGGRADRVRWAVPGTLVAIMGVYCLGQSLPHQAKLHKNYNGISASALRSAERAGLKNALVFVELDPEKPYRDYGKVSFANDPLLRGDRIYVRDMGQRKNRALTRRFPDRTAYWLPLDGPPHAGFAPKRARAGDLEAGG